MHSSFLESKAVYKQEVTVPGCALTVFCGERLEPELSGRLRTCRKSTTTELEREENKHPSSIWDFTILSSLVLWYPLLINVTGNQGID